MMATVYGIPFLDSSEINNIKEYNQIRHADYKLIITPLVCAVNSQENQIF